ncbi:glycosyltransferase family 1 protein [Halarcobacter ebronensis]|uniref:Glycosyltransferase family 1 protein n=1 Tax=Halarcobacter ebronensis TaxID=1462615 RepID=A0A4Q0YJC1_9BACT|nr:glycosyltransferase [Halarcobacter ebronensis]RXJ69011.1 glycosyltransferase family 1 protein [Halarcobacter ebronensis]
MKKRICIVSTTGSVVNAFMLRHIEYLKNEYDVTVVLGDDIPLKVDVKVKKIKIIRKIDLMQDIKSLYKLLKYFKKKKFDLVLSIMPKSGLLSMISAMLVGINIRLHFFTGQVWATKKGFFKTLLKYMDKVIVKCSTNILVDSNSQKEFLESEKVLDSRGSILNKGSISGVNTNYFKPNINLKNELRKKYNIVDSEIVFMYLGRINIDKGVIELADTFLSLFNKFSKVKLVLMGPLEDLTIKEKIKELLINENVIYDFSYINNPQEILNLADILVLPSHREGFGTIVIEAAALKVPTIGSNIYGLSDSIVDKQTGVLHKVNDIEDMVKQYSNIILNKNLINQMGENAYKRVQKDFLDETLSLALLNYIREKIDK